MTTKKYEANRKNTPQAKKNKNNIFSQLGICLALNYHQKK